MLMRLVEQRFEREKTRVVEEADMIEVIPTARQKFREGVGNILQDFHTRQHVIFI